MPDPTEGLSHWVGYEQERRLKGKAHIFSPKNIWRAGDTAGAKVPAWGARGFLEILELGQCYQSMTMVEGEVGQLGRSPPSRAWGGHGGGGHLL